MKRPWTTAVLLGILAAAPAMVVRADESEAGMQGPDSKEHHHGDPAKMQKKLGLTDDQVAKLKSLKDSQKDTMKTLWDKQRDLMKKLEDQVKNKAADKDVQGTLDELKATRAAMRTQMEQFQSQREAILTPTQRAKMLLGRREHMHHDKDHHKTSKD